MKSKLMSILIVAALIPSVSFAKKPVKPDQHRHVVWVDANGVMLGDAQNEVSDLDIEIYFEIDEKLYVAKMYNDDFYSFNLHYDKPDCTGNAYVPDGFPLDINGVLHLFANRDGIFYGPDGTVPQAITVMSHWKYPEFPEAVCETTNQAGNFIPAVPFLDVTKYKKPYQLKLLPAH